MKLNAEDGGNRKFIMVQMPEPCDENSEAYKAGYKNICRKSARSVYAGRAERNTGGAPGSGRQAPIPACVLRGGFLTNMQDVYYGLMNTPRICSPLTDNIKPDRTRRTCFPGHADLGVLLSSKIEEMVIGGKKVFNVADGYLMACFDNDVTDEVVREIAKKQPYYAVFRDSGMASDSVATNFEQIFATYSPSTIRKVL